MITGLSALTTAGTDLDALWEAYKSGRETTSVEDGKAIGRVEFSASDYLKPKDRKRVDRLGLLSIISSQLALQDAGLEVNDENTTRVGAILGTGVGPMESMVDFAVPVIQEGADSANPAMFPNTVYNAAAGQVAMKVGITGSTSTVTAGHAAGASSLVYGVDLAATDHADAVVCIGADALTDTVINAYSGLGVLKGAATSGSGAGFAISEAGIAILTERLGKASKRGARIYGEVLGYGITSDATGVGRIDPDGGGIERAMRVALERGGVAAADVKAVWSAQSGLTVADEAEAKAIQRVFGEGPKVIAPKIHLGEPMGAGASLSTALALKGWQEGDEEASPKGPVLVNGISLGGTNFSILLAPATEA